MKTKQFIVGIIALIIISIALYYIIHVVLSLFSIVNPQTITTLLSITIPLVASILTIYLGRYFEKEKILQEKIREKKIPIYDDFMVNSLRFMFSKDEKNKEGELIEFLKKMTPKLIVWADDKVLKSWSNFRYSATENPGGKELMFKYQAIVLAMRKDLGHKNKGLDNNEILKCFINDVEDTLPKKD